VLVAVEGELEGAAFPLREGTSRLGSSPACEVPLASERIAPEHACIDYRAGFFRVDPVGDAELGVNFERTGGTLLRDGDYLQLGATTLRFRTVVGA
jgi:hypothetical protein